MKENQLKRRRSAPQKGIIASSNPTSLSGEASPRSWGLWEISYPSVLAWQDEFLANPDAPERHLSV
jgi:hypothetical protein